ncbi:MAG TPA: MMPL family transporter [Aggregatilinea sp.]|jgi:RND superfamily putative drug exporter|uniref:MMPL family transporter n=1 Tax=Aggregatilinea sp. TaxID=2806333 RepID=UPI002BF19012|nr:MMPL family transporter [Aggregatilinea sp.]HML20703.1 MMPL family transporter [Aggregatilinea sp.]
MFFEKIGHFATRYRSPILLVWIVTAIVVTVVSPNIDKVASSNMSDFLPDEAPFIHASDVINDTFGKGLTSGSTVIVIDAREAGGIRSDETWTFLEDFKQWLTSDEAPDTIARAVSPTDSEALANMMISKDGGVGLMRIALTTSGTEKATGETLDTIEAWMQDNLPPGVEAYQTGDSPIVNNTTESVKTSVDRTIWVTVILVIVMLLIVYRSPVSPFIPLVSVTLAYLITRGIVAWLGDTVMTITSYANVMMVVVMYGAGTDYCLFLISRFREEMADHPTIDKATSHTVHLVGETISSSAGTIFVGFMAMTFAKMGIFKTSGPALAIGIVLSLLAGLTLVPALLSTLGQKAFWPGEATHRSPGRLYEFTSKQVSSRPLLTIVLIVVLMLPFSIYGVSQRVNYNMLDDLPKDQPAVRGFAIMNETMGSGEILPMTVVVTGRDPNEIAVDMVHLSNDLVALDGVKYVRSLNDPLGEEGELTNLLRVDVQLRLAMQMFSQTGTGGDGASMDMQQLGGMLESLRSYFDLLAQDFPEVADDPNLATIQDLLGNPMRLIQGRDELATAIEGLAARFETIDDAYVLPTMFIDLLGQMPADQQGGNVAMLGQLLPNYITDDHTAYKLEVILDVPPTSYEAMDTVHAIRDVLDEYKDGGEAVVGGSTATVTDIKDVMDGDLLRAIGLVLLGIFLVLLVMLRSAVAPLYLIGTVLLSFTFTLGVTNLIFKSIDNAAGLTWYVPFFTFVFLVALGVDYSIFLFGRIKEEVGYHGIREGVHVAVARTGAIITSAGMILAGTFGAMISGEIRGLVEVGFAVAFGVLIDTFVVRTILDPALATLFGHWTWWPGGVPKPRTQRPSQSVASGEAAD